MILNYFRFVFLVVAFILSGQVSHASAFSFEGIDIHSKFGERFTAELDVVLEEEGFLRVQIGDEEDYRRLQLNRPRIVDDLIIEASPETGALRKTVRVTSKRPLFFPSFFLVVRGTFKGGTILERYLITVDFQQSLALQVKGKTKADKPSEKEKADSLKGEETTADLQTPAVVETKPADEIKSPETAAIEKEPAPEKVNPEIPGRQAFVKTQKSNRPTHAPAWMAKPPSTIWGRRGEDSYFPGARWILPPATPPAMPPMDPPQPDLQREEQESSLAGSSSGPLANEENMISQKSSMARSSSGPLTNGENLISQESSMARSSYGPLANGETLLSIARKLDVGPVEEARVAAALWMDNPESFLFGNMHGLRVGSEIRLDNLEKRLEEIDSQLALKIIRNQLQEWMVIRDKLFFAENEGFDGSTEEIPLPSEIEEEKKRIFEMLQTWKTSWEKGDLEQHLALFSDRATGGVEEKTSDLIALKKRMFSRHKKVKLGIKHASLRVNGEQAIVSFGQSFSSGQIESYGRKDIDIVKESGAWKILKEKFKVNEFVKKSGPSSEVFSVSQGKIFSRERTFAVPYVIHASSHLDYQMATRVVNDLRVLGFNAYSCPVSISGKRKIYRVFVGRFSGMDLAQELVTELRKHGLAQNAIPVKYPYTLLVGEYEQEDEAESLIRYLRSRGWSPLLFTFSEKEFLNPRFRVFLGAFATETKSERLSAELDDQRLPFKLITP